MSREELDRDAFQFFQQAPITLDPRYQDALLLAKAYELPVARRYLRDNGRHIAFQPRQGYCGVASLNTVLLSLPDLDCERVSPRVRVAAPLAFPERPHAMSLDELTRALVDALHQREVPVRKVSAVDRFANLDEFRRVLQLANDPEHRLIANFLRTPLFYSDQDCEVQRRRIYGGHFSPIGGYLPEEDLVLVLDVNAQFGFWLTPSARLFEACGTRDPTSGRCRGLIVLQLDAPLAALPALPDCGPLQLKTTPIVTDLRGALVDRGHQ